MTLIRKKISQRHRKSSKKARYEKKTSKKKKYNRAASPVGERMDTKGEEVT